MEKEEELVLKSLGWKGKGLIKSAHDALNDGSLQTDISDSTFFGFFTWTISTGLNSMAHSKGIHRVC